MDLLREFLEAVTNHGLTSGHFRALLHILVGRRITLVDGTLVSAGLTWRELASQLRKHRWDPDLVRELNLDPSSLAPRDRERFWYSAICQAGLSSKEASDEADALLERLRELGYEVGPGPKR